MMERADIKCLIYSRNPLSERCANGKTNAMIFQNFSKGSLAQLYISDMEPDDSICNKYYKVFSSTTELSEKKSIIKQFFFTVIFLLKKIRFFEHTFRLIRNKKWKKVKKEPIYEWISDFSPDIMYIGATDFYFELSFCLEIANYLGIPFMLGISDNYYIKDLKIYEKKYYKKLNSVFELAYHNSAINIYQTEQMKILLDEFFGIYKGDFLYITNGVNITKLIPERKEKKSGQALEFLYAGNLGIGRAKTLISVCKALNELYQEGIKLHLAIYVNGDFYKKNFRKFNFVDVYSTIPYEQLEKKYINSDFILHIESFSKKYSNLLKGSFSTKATELMYYERPAILIGPKYSTTLDFFKRNCIGFVSNNYKLHLLKQDLKFFINNKMLQSTYVKNSKKMVLRNFNKSELSNKVYDLISKVVIKRLQGV